MINVTLYHNQFYQKATDSKNNDKNHAPSSPFLFFSNNFSYTAEVYDIRE